MVAGHGDHGLLIQYSGRQSASKKIVISNTVGPRCNSSIRSLKSEYCYKEVKLKGYNELNMMTVISGSYPMQFFQVEASFFL